MSERRGRPLAFLARLLAGWVLLRIGMALVPPFWTVAGPGGAFDRFGPLSDTRFHGPLTDWGGPPPPVVGRATHREAAQDARRTVRRVGAAERNAQASTPDRARDTGGDLVGPRPASGQWQRDVPPPALAARESEQAIPPAPPATLPRPAMTLRDRWSAVTWLLWRPDSQAQFAQAPLLGGSQAGLRVDYRLTGSGTRNLSLYGRLSRALERPHAEEAAFGLALRPVKHVPVAIMIERRQKLGDGGRSAFAVLAAGGAGPGEIARRVELEGYGEAGFVGLPGSDGFADGRLALGYRLTARGAHPDVTIGASLSGGVQSGAQRLDLGPELRLRLPVGRTHVRLSAEWRQRIAGDARPASGPAVVLVADF